MADKLTQRMLPFDEVTPVEISLAVPDRATARYEPSDEARAAFARLEDWLLDPRTRRPGTELAEDALRSLARPLLEGKNGYFHAAEDHLEALKLRNGKAERDDIPAGAKAAEGNDFQRDVEDVFDLLHERMLTRGSGRPV